ncbi:MAG: hypothetical protein ABI883_04095, partial [Chthoniobacterales bacterium]
AHATMKPTSPASLPARHRNAQPALGRRIPASPATDWTFQASAPALRGGSAKFGGGRPVLSPEFRALTEGRFSAEAKREPRLEGVLFGVIAAVAAWPMVLAFQAATTLVR